MTPTNLAMPLLGFLFVAALTASAFRTTIALAGPPG